MTTSIRSTVAGPWVLSDVVGTVRLPTRKELRAMLNRPSVMITAILAVTVIVLAFVGAVVFLAYHGKGTEALVVAVITPIVGILVNMSSRLKTVEKNTGPNTGPSR